ncbi:MAG TPA: GNAT family N-acetyltransferase [Noviherbaspirillum sp.]
MKRPEMSTTISLRGNTAAAKPHMMGDGASISCYCNEVPTFVEPELIRLYGSAFSTLEHFRAYGGLEQASTYVARNGTGQLVSVLLFRIENRTVRVLNELIRIGQEEVAQFAGYIFATFEQVRVISFNAVELEIGRLPFVCQRFNCSEDIALALPPTPEAYLAQLGKATRKNIKHHLSRLRRQFPTLRFEARCNEEIDASRLRDIAAHNHARMTKKHKTSYLDDEESTRLLRLVRSSGLVTALTIDGRVCAGAICSLVGDNYFSYVNAHDPSYDTYRLGTLCCYLTICECIVRGGREFHLLWGRDLYKYTLAGTQRNLDHFDIYRSPAACLPATGRMLQNAARSAMRQTRFWLLDPQRQNRHPLLRRTLGILRRIALRTSGAS